MFRQLVFFKFSLFSKLKIQTISREDCLLFLFVKALSFSLQFIVDFEMYRLSLFFLYVYLQTLWHGVKKEAVSFWNFNLFLTTF